VDIYW